MYHALWLYCDRILSKKDANLIAPFPVQNISASHLDAVVGNQHDLAADEINIDRVQWFYRVLQRQVCIINEQHAGSNPESLTFAGPRL